MPDAIVVGAGLGGIAAAARLARHGFQVTVVERRSEPGGRCHNLERDGFRFDSGPTLFLMPAVFREIYEDLGERIEDHLDLVRIDPAYRVHFHDGTHLDLTSNLVRMQEQLEALESGAFEAFLHFMASGCRHYNLSLKHFVGRNFYTVWDNFNPLLLFLVCQMKALTTHYRHTSRHFRDRRLRAAFSFQNMYLGLSPFDAPATYSLLQYSELSDGVWFPRGGMYKIIKTLVQIARNLGVRFLYNSPVGEVVLEGQSAKGVELETKERLKADIVVVNADLPYAYNALLPKGRAAARLMHKRYSSSTLMFYWGVRGERSTALLHHNAFLADHRYRESFDQIFRDQTLPEEPSFYVNAATRTDLSCAPEGHDAITVLVPVGHLNDKTPQDWDRLKERGKKAVFDGLARLGLPDLSSSIVMEEMIGPQQWEHEYNVTKGAAFGLRHNFLQVGYLRPHNRHPRYRNLYFVGASTHPGTGLPIVLLSARLVVERIMKEHAGGIPVQPHRP